MEISLSNFNLKETFNLAFKTAILIVKLIIPLYIFADILFYFNILSKISFIFKPLTTIIHLPPESAIGLASGIFFNIYAAIAFLAPLNLTPYQWTIIGVFLGIAHAIIVESAIMKKIGIPVFYSIGLRFIVGVIGALLVIFLPFKFSTATSVNTQIEAAKFNSFYEMITHSISKATSLSVKIILLITVIVFVVNFLKSLPFIEKYQEKVSTPFSIFVGLFLGITYGAGILITEAKSGNMKKEDLFFVGTFLLIAHAIIEDPALFIIFGANGFIMIGIRLILAVIVSFLFTILFKRFAENPKLSGQK